MKILYIGSRYSYRVDGTVSKQNDSADYRTWYQALCAFRPEEHTVVPFWFVEIMRQRGKKAMNEELLAVLEKEKPDIAFFIVGDDEITTETLRKVALLPHMITVYVCGDDSWRFDSNSKRFAPFYNWVLTGEWPMIERYHRLGCKNVVYYQSWPNTDLFKPTDKAKDIEVSFIGTCGPARKKIVAAIRKAGIPVLVRGRGWPEGEVNEQELVDITARSKIVLALNEPAFYAGIKPLVRLFLKRSSPGSRFQIRIDTQNFFRNFQEWWSKRKPNIKGRMFEVPACRVLQLVYRVYKFDTFYESGKEMVMYDTTGELIEKIRYYLAHEREREAIAEAGYQRTLAEHTAQKRMEAIFSQILSRDKVGI